MLFFLGKLNQLKILAVILSARKISPKYQHFPQNENTASSGTFPLVIKALGMAGDDIKQTWFVRLNAVGGEHERAARCRE